MHGTLAVVPGPFAALVPLGHDYAVAPTERAFNWSECLAPVERGEWYVVAFRSVRRPGSDDTLMEEFDRRAFEEASRHTGLLCYFMGELDDERRCLSMCVWEERSRAREAAALPEHTRRHRDRRRDVLVVRPGAIPPDQARRLGGPGGHRAAAAVARRARPARVARPRLAYFDADSDSPTAACPAARRAVSTRYGEQLT